MARILIRWLILTAAILAASYLVDGIVVTGFWAAFFAAAILGFLNVFFKPLLIILTLPVNILTSGALHPRHQRGAAEDRLGAHPGLRRPRLLACRLRRRHHQRRRAGSSAPSSPTGAFPATPETPEAPAAAAPGRSISRRRGSAGNEFSHARHAAVSRDQGPVPRLHPLFPHGRFLRDVLRGRRAGLEAAGYHAHLPRQGQGGQRAAVRVSLARRVVLHRETHREGPQGGHLRADGGPPFRQGHREARGGARDHPGARRRPRQPGGQGEQLPGRHCRSRRGVRACLPGHLHGRVPGHGGRRTATSSSTR